MTNLTELIPHIEALIFASDKPLSSSEITDLINQAFGFMEDKIEVEQVESSLESIVQKYNSDYPFEVRQSGGGWQFLTKKDFHKTVAQLNGEKFLKRLSAASLETLSIIAYKQPVTKGEIESIRGVSSDYAVQKLLEKELIVISGRNEKLPGHPLVYVTSKNFMDYFGMNSPNDLPKIKEVLAEQMIEPTKIHHTSFETGETLVVSDEGQLIDVDTKNNDEEGYVNGHNFDLPAEENSEHQSSGETTTEDLPSEEAAEEFIADETFVEADEEEAAEGVKENIPDEENNKNTSSNTDGDKGDSFGEKEENNS